MTNVVLKSKLSLSVRSSMHPHPGNWVAIWRAVVFTVYAFSAGIICRRFTCIYKIRRTNNINKYKIQKKYVWKARIGNEYASICLYGMQTFIQTPTLRRRVFPLTGRGVLGILRQTLGKNTCSLHWYFKFPKSRDGFARNSVRMVQKQPSSNCIYIWRYLLLILCNSIHRSMNFQKQKQKIE